MTCGEVERLFPHLPFYLMEELSCLPLFLYYRHLENIECFCGSMISVARNMNVHIKTKKHNDFVLGSGPNERNSEEGKANPTGVGAN